MPQKMKPSIVCVILVIAMVCTSYSEAHAPRKHNRNFKRFDTGTMWPIEVSSFYGFESKYPRSYIPNPLTRRVKKTIRDPTVFRSNYSPYFVPHSQRVTPWGHEHSTPWRRNTKYSSDRLRRPTRQNSFQEAELRQTQASQAGCDTPSGFRPGGSTWPLSGCGRGVCAITLEGSWVPSEDRCDGLVQNPQYQCLMNEDQSLPFPDCCARPVQCREIGAKPARGP